VLILYERSKATAAINVGALAINLVGDVVLIGVLGAGLIGPAVACALALAFIAGGYLVVAGRCLGVPVGVPATVAMAPAVALVATLALPAGWALVAAVAGVGVAVATASATGLFSSADAGLIERLPLPGAARRRLLSLLGAGGR
jgi:hypothetical protein